MIILSNVSKVYVRRILEQMSHYFVNLLSKFQCGFQQSFSAQQCLSILIEKGRKTRDLKGAFTKIETDLSNAFDRIPRDLLIDQLGVFDFHKSNLLLFQLILRAKNKERRPGQLLVFLPYTL